MSASKQRRTPKTFDADLARLKAEVRALGALVEQAVGYAIQALGSGDPGLTRECVAHERRVTELELRCEALICRIVPSSQPATADVRFTLASVKVVSDLERMGDLAAGLCRHALFLDGAPARTAAILEQMGRLVRGQVARALDALDRGDVALAMEVIEQERNVDVLYRDTYRKVLAAMVDNPHHISDYMRVSDIAKHLEWIADHAANLCETVIYTVRGHEIRRVNHEQAALLCAEA